MQEPERDQNRLSTTKQKFDESKLLPEQKAALNLAKAQGVKPIRSLNELRLDIDEAELEKFANALDEQRQQARTQSTKSKT